MGRRNKKKDNKRFGMAKEELKDKRRTGRLTEKQKKESEGQKEGKGRVTFRVFQRPQDSEADGIINSNFPASCSQGLWQKPLV